MGKILFFLNRYYPICNVIFNQYVLLTSNLTDDLCRFWFRWQGWTAVCSCMIAQSILQVRLYALYFLDKKILFIMVVGFVATSACSAAIMGNVLSKITVRSHLIPGFPFCTPLSFPTYLYAFWIPILAFESLLCGMALFRGFQAFRYRQSVFHAGRQLVTLLLRDSIVYYLVVFVTYLVTLLLWSTSQPGLIEIPVGFAVAMSCIMGNRLILNVRLMKRKMEQSNDADRSVLQLPLTRGAAARNNTPSEVEFAREQITPLSPDSQSEFEWMELKDLERDSIPRRHIVTI